MNGETLQSRLSDEEVYEIVSRTPRQLITAHVVKAPKAGLGVDIGGDHFHMGSISECVLSSSAAGIKWLVAKA